MPLNDAEKFEIKKQVISIIAAELHFDEMAEKTITRGQHLQGLGMDSLSIQSVLLDIEEHFALHDLPIDSSDSVTIGDIIDEVEKAIAEEVVEDMEGD